MNPQKQDLIPGKDITGRLAERKRRIESQKIATRKARKMNVTKSNEPDPIIAHQYVKGIKKCMTCGVEFESFGSGNWMCDKHRSGEIT